MPAAPEGPATMRAPSRPDSSASAPATHASSGSASAASSSGARKSQAIVDATPAARPPIAVSNGGSATLARPRRRLRPKQSARHGSTATKRGRPSPHRCAKWPHTPVARPPTPACTKRCVSGAEPADASASSISAARSV